MATLKVFENISLDGYFTDAHGKMEFARKDPHDKEWTEYVSGNAGGSGLLIFGRITYQEMASFWPTPMAAQMLPVVAKRMNASPKVVFSRTLPNAAWAHSRLIKEDPVGAIRALKESATDMVILGSGSLVAQLAPYRLIDEYQFVVAPVALGAGRTLFQGIREPVPLRLTKSRAFGNGNVVLSYVPA
jgi:dihydrofolate reductase